MTNPNPNPGDLTPPPTDEKSQPEHSPRRDTGNDPEEIETLQRPDIPQPKIPNPKD